MADNWKEHTFDSGVRVRYGPFPHGAYWDIMARALEEYPDPEVPMKTVEVVDGTEEMEDWENEGYKAEKRIAELARAEMMVDATLEWCIELVEDFEPAIERLKKKWVKDVPDDPIDRKVWFLRKFAIRTTDDWNIIAKCRRYSQIEDEEVADRAEFFRGEVAGSEGAGADASGAAEK